LGVVEFIAVENRGVWAWWHQSRWKIVVFGRVGIHRVGKSSGLGVWQYAPTEGHGPFLRIFIGDWERGIVIGRGGIHRGGKSWCLGVVEFIAVETR
jgi:hypothetical protein